MQNKTSGKRGNKQDSLLRAVIVASLFWVVYSLYIDDFISNDLRLISSIIAEKILTLLNIAVERQGNVILRNELRFEVIAACSGSTILKVMLGSGIFLSLSWRNLKQIQRVETILLSAVIAVFANGVRVTILVLLGIQRGSAIPEGLLHNTIGIVTFIVAFTLLCHICIRMSRKAITTENKNSRSGLSARYRLILTILLLIFLYLPFICDQFMDWFGSDWNSSNHLGFIFYIIPAILILLQLHKQKQPAEKRPRPLPAADIATGICLVSGLLCGITSHILGIITLGGIGLIIIFAGLIIQLFPLRQALLTLPLLLLPILGFPRVILRLRDLTPAMNINPEIERFILLIAIVILQQILYYTLTRSTSSEDCQPVSKVKVNAGPALYSFFFYASILALTIALIFPAGSAQLSGNDKKISEYNLPYYLHNWVGTDISLSQSDIAYFGRSNIIYRRYSSITDKKLPSVELLITFSAGNRHKIHPPEFCQSGAGWNIVSNSPAAIPTTPEHEGTLLTLSKNTQTKYLLYYFSTKGKDENNYSEMMLSNIVQILSGKKKDWATVRIFSKSSKATLLFAEQLPSPLL